MDELVDKMAKVVAYTIGAIIGGVFSAWLFWSIWLWLAQKIFSSWPAYITNPEFLQFATLYAFLVAISFGRRK